MSGTTDSASHCVTVQRQSTSGARRRRVGMLIAGLCFACVCATWIVSYLKSGGVCYQRWLGGQGADSVTASACLLDGELFIGFWHGVRSERVSYSRQQFGRSYEPSLSGRYHAYYCWARGDSSGFYEVMPERSFVNAAGFVLEACREGGFWPPYPGQPYQHEIRGTYAAVPLWIPLALSAGVLFTLAPRPNLRRHWRQNRGLCGRCGYDVRANQDRCPECGQGIPGDHVSSGEPGVNS